MPAALAAATNASSLSSLDAVDAAAAHGRELRGVQHHARSAEHGRDIGGAGNGVLFAEDRRDALVAVDAVLQGDDASVRADQRLRKLGGDLGVPQLDGEQHDVDRADLLGIVAWRSPSADAGRHARSGSSGRPCAARRDGRGARCRPRRGPPPACVRRNTSRPRRPPSLRFSCPLRLPIARHHSGSPARLPMRRMPFIDGCYARKAQTGLSRPHGEENAKRCVSNHGAALVLRDAGFARSSG